MTHPGLPWLWAAAVCVFMVLVGLWALASGPPAPARSRSIRLDGVPVLGAVIRAFSSSPVPLFVLKAVSAGFFLLVIAAGLWGTPVPERNLATVLTWNVWWTGVVISVFFVGTFWCAVCPWDALAEWMVRRRLWRRGGDENRLGLSVPPWLRSLWPALFLLLGLTWLELGLGITVSPYETALLAVFMTVLVTVSMAVFERKAFCRYFCPVGRTLGMYARLAPVELRPREREVCDRCETLECYHGSSTVEPCPTHLTMGRLRQNTYCLSCCNCVQSCPHDNVSWRLRPQSLEAVRTVRPFWDEALFMVTLLALTSFHGVTMMPFWEEWMSGLGRMIGDSGRLLASFSLLLAAVTAAAVLVYGAFVALTHRLCGGRASFREAFFNFALVALPPAFAYHLAHNINHLARESSGLGALLLNPLGTGTVPLTMAERHMRAMTSPVVQDAIFSLQAALLAFGFWLAVRIARHRGRDLYPGAGWRLAPMIVFAAAVTALNLRLLMEPMVMRM
ncbi:MAG TPA: 4Fe-4S binding protein [Deltaproteobacteria bacterium]|nr:4Fe-4S binding protein [Deltaproteobacteria bacterium]